MKKQELNFQIEAFIQHVKANYNPNKPLVFWIDLFCGAGGTSSGIHFSGLQNMFVAACVNHDANAINSHKENHPHALHFTEDVRNFDVVLYLTALVERLRQEFPDCVINLWGSLECTNFSNAKGGQARDADSRSLAEHMYMYLEHLKPDSFWIENVREFMSWGPLDKNKKPISKTAGTSFTKWVKKVESFGFKSDKVILNSADFGACQKRRRLFMQFAKPQFEISWPIPTHSENPEASNLKKYNAVKKVLQLDLEGNSIFNRKRALSENTLKRIYAGLNKFIAQGEKGFTKQYNSGSDSNRVKSLNEPIGTITTNNRFALVQTHLSTYYGNFGLHSIDEPSPTVTTKDRISKIDVNFMDAQYGNSKPSSIDEPIGTLTTVPKFNLIKAKQYILNPSWGGHNSSIEEPSCTIIARQDKAPLYLVTTKLGLIKCPIYEDDSETMIKIKEFMVCYGIVDILMRMLIIDELKQIQGFPINYKLIGTQAEQKKYIGNAVEVNQAKAIVRNNYLSLIKFKQSKAA